MLKLQFVIFYPTFGLKSINFKKNFCFVKNFNIKGFFLKEALKMRTVEGGR